MRPPRPPSAAASSAEALPPTCRPRLQHRGAGQGVVTARAGGAAPHAARAPMPRPRQRCCRLRVVHSTFIGLLGPITRSSCRLRTRLDPADLGAVSGNNPGYTRTHSPPEPSMAACAEPRPRSEQQISVQFFAATIIPCESLGHGDSCRFFGRQAFTRTATVRYAGGVTRKQCCHPDGLASQAAATAGEWASWQRAERGNNWASAWDGQHVASYAHPGLSCSAIAVPHRLSLPLTHPVLTEHTTHIRSPPLQEAGSPGA